VVGVAVGVRVGGGVLVGVSVGTGVLAGVGGHVTSTTGHALDPTLLGLAFIPVM
jgi:hypothetical protein